MAQWIPSPVTVAGAAALREEFPSFAFPFHLLYVGRHQHPATLGQRGAQVKLPKGFPMTDENTRHREKMQKIKAARDHMMEGKTGEKGLIIVLTGPGKGKSSSAFGMLCRAVAHQMPAAVVQFIKGAWGTGERDFFAAHFSKEVTWVTSGEGFTWETQDKERDIAAAKAGWEKAKDLIRNPANRFVLLDEINIALRYDYLDIDEVVDFLLNEKPEMTHVVLTGRNAKDELIEAADLVTEMAIVKHPFRDGIKAQKGVEF